MLPYFRLRGKNIIELYEPGHLMWAKSKDGLLRKSLGEALNVVLGGLERFHCIDGRVSVKIGESSYQKSSLFLDSCISKNVAKNAAFVSLIIALPF